MTRVLCYQILLLVLAASSPPGGARQSEPAPPGLEKRAAASPVPAALAEAESSSPRVRVQVITVVRSGPEAITVQFRLLNPDATALVSIGDAFADTTGDGGSISGVYLLDATGQRKAFVLRDERGQPQCSTGLGPLPPRGQVDAWGRYPVPAPGATRVTVQVPGLTAFRDLPVGDAPRGTGSAGSSY